MQHYRVTKYDPARRDLTGAYLSDDWTAHSDIGQSFAGVALTEERYLAAENAYLESAVAFLKEAGVRELAVVGLENAGEHPNPPRDGAAVSIERLPEVLRSLLREEYWCKLEGQSAFVHVGWDYYMYIGVLAPCPVAESVAQSRGLFVEQIIRSPYAEDAA
ncbi:hypothetical protein HNQ60_005366 [Povalibacter uvarum]|uniref:Uncharacterized protein n=1 Tax=Povalibacter uvarum TaxID=732238 RepID=A0A841HUV9_9GAMM|nr:hypothetical protein [Povalibacter uvarum]MBB6096444.1 hypothetical protein [Povalibacter uvarum]